MFEVVHGLRERWGNTDFGGRIASWGFAVGSGSAPLMAVDGAGRSHRLSAAVMAGQWSLA